ncbi:MAG: ATP-binding protein, partial [Caldilineaceae bacterium]|nr:ATP-binding protein [Caldilineaceae bacterium]
MTESSNYQTSNPPMANPYVGPRTFTYEQRHLFFGREREARDLLARVVSERVLLFYAQSGAGKSSLLHTRLIPQLREEEGFAVLPVGRVSGELPTGVTDVANIYLFNLMTSLDQSNEEPQRLAQLPFSRFLARSTSDDGRHWYYAAAPATPDLDFEVARITEDEIMLAAYDPAIDDEVNALAEDADAMASRSLTATASANAEQRYVLIIDQFEEIITTHPHRRQAREIFFRQLNQALLDDPNLWVVLTLREDYVAALDPYAHLMADKLRARFYMERMGVDAAQAAVTQPAALAGRPFAEGVAEALVDNLRRVKALGQVEEQLGQYIEPVQLQVVCYQLWAKVIGHNANAATITLTDLQQSGDVNTALADFYNQALATVLASFSISERQLRTWFDHKLITEAGTRGTVYQGLTETEGMPNPL